MHFYFSVSFYRVPRSTSYRVPSFWSLLFQHSILYRTVFEPCFSSSVSDTILCRAAMATVVVFEVGRGALIAHRQRIVQSCYTFRRSGALCRRSLLSALLYIVGEDTVVRVRRIFHESLNQVITCFVRFAKLYDYQYMQLWILMFPHHHDTSLEPSLLGSA